MSVLTEKFKEVVGSVLPIALLVIVLHLTVAPLEGDLLIKFFIGTAVIIIGLTIFLIGVDQSVRPIGQHMGGWMTKKGKLTILIIGALLLGFVISVAEPDLHILANEVEAVTDSIIPALLMVFVVSVGIAIMMTIGLVRTVFDWSIRTVLLVAYAVIGVLSIFAIPEILAIAFDASGATTGAMTVPFMLALLLGVSSIKKNGRASVDDSFGLVGTASTGAILGVLVLGLIMGVDRLDGDLPQDELQHLGIGETFAAEVPAVLGTTLLALVPIFVIFLIFNFVKLKLKRNSFRRIMIGGVFSFAGLFLFLLGVNAGFMEVGSYLGGAVALRNPVLVVFIGFLLGFVTILAEPAVHVLTNQIEDVTAGYVPRKTVFLTLSIGVGVAVALSMLRTLVPEIQLWHYLLPGFGLGIIMMYFTPTLFVGMAYDSGGVASGPMTATFILAFANGVASAVPTADVMIDGFGMIAIVAMTPIIAIQILGMIFKYKQRKKEKTSDPVS